MAFELETMTKVKCLDVRTLAKKDRKPDESPGSQLLLQAVLPLDVLAMFDGFLSGMLFRKPKAPPQGKLEGMEGAELTGIGEHVKRLPWTYEQTGCEIEIDRGLGGRRSNITLSDCKVHRVSLMPQQGGGVKTQWTIDAPALSDETRGKLTGLKATEIEMTIAAPEPADDAQGDLTDESPPRSGRGRQREPAGAAA